MSFTFLSPLFCLISCRGLGGELLTFSQTPTDTFMLLACWVTNWPLGPSAHCKWGLESESEQRPPPMCEVKLVTLLKQTEILEPCRQMLVRKWGLAHLYPKNVRRVLENKNRGLWMEAGQLFHTCCTVHQQSLLGGSKERRQPGAESAGVETPSPFFFQKTKIKRRYFFRHKQVSKLVCVMDFWPISLSFVHSGGYCVNCVLSNCSPFWAKGSLHFRAAVKFMRKTTSTSYVIGFKFHSDA